MQSGASATPQPTAGVREWIGLVLLALPALVVAMDVGVLFLALPHLTADLNLTGPQQLWVSDIYGFMVAGFLATMGSLGDRIGRRRLLFIGTAAFTAASVLAAFSTSGAMLIIARALLGIAGASLSPSTLSLISNMFRNDRQRGLAISIWATAMFGGSALGPVTGGIMLEWFWWGSVFLVGLPVMVALLIAGPFLLPEFRPGNAGRLDLVSVLLSLGAVLPVVWGIKEFTASDVEQPGIAALVIAAGLAVGVLFVRRQTRLADPMIDLSLFRSSAVSSVMAAMMLASAGLAGMGLMTTQYIQSVLGLSPGTSGLWQAPTGIGIAVGSMLAPFLVRKLQPLRAIVLGMSISATSLLVITQAGPSGWLITVVVAGAMIAFGVGPLFALGTGMVIGAVPPEKAGSAASLSETSNVFGSTLGLAVMGSVGAAVYRSQMSDAELSEVPADAIDAARENLAAANNAAQGLPDGAGAELSRVAGVAFTDAMNVVAGVGAVIFIGLIVLIVTVVRRQNGAAPTPAEETEVAGRDDSHAVA
jgi:DHA2 family multidrug resistance protein-like MFS transporter